MPDKPILQDIVRRLMWRRGWCTIFELQAAISQEHGRWLSDAGLSARVRDQRKGKYGGFIVECRLGKGRTYEYRLKH